jgi:hypothetical protein
MPLILSQFVDWKDFATQCLLQTLRLENIQNNCPRCRTPPISESLLHPGNVWQISRWFRYCTSFFSGIPLYTVMANVQVLFLFQIGDSSTSYAQQIAAIQRLCEKSGVKYSMHATGTTLGTYTRHFPGHSRYSNV